MFLNAAFSFFFTYTRPRRLCLLNQQHGTGVEIRCVRRIISRVLGCAMELTACQHTRTGCRQGVRYGSQTFQDSVLHGEDS